MRLLTLFRNELTKMYRQRGTYAGPVLLTIFIGLFIWGVWAEGAPFDEPDRMMSDEFAVGGNLISGPAIPYYLLELPVAINVFIPLLLSMIAGGLIAGEAQRGTLRTLLTRPVHRWQIVVAKVAAAFVHATVLVLVLGGVSLIGGWLVFGRGDLVTVRGGLRIFSEAQALQRLGLAYGAVMLTMWAVAAIAVFCSTIFEHPLTASGVTVAFLIVSATLMVIPYFEWLKPYLLTDHFAAYRHAFERPVAWDELKMDLAWILAYGTAAVVGTLTVFCRRDMTC